MKLKTILYVLELEFLFIQEIYSKMDNEVPTTNYEELLISIQRNEYGQLSLFIY